MTQPIKDFSEFEKRCQEIIDNFEKLVGQRLLDALEAISLSRQKLSANRDEWEQEARRRFYRDCIETTEAHIQEQLKKAKLQIFRDRRKAQNKLKDDNGLGRQPDGKRDGPRRKAKRKTGRVR